MARSFALGASKCPPPLYAFISTHMYQGMESYIKCFCEHRLRVMFAKVSCCANHPTQRQCAGGGYFLRPEATTDDVLTATFY